MRLPFAAIAFATLALSSSFAAAQAPGQTMSYELDPTPPGAVTPQVETVSYRHELIVADALSLSLIVTGPFVTPDAQLSMYGFTGYMLAAPIIHIAHGRGVAAVESLALRGGLPFVGGMLGYRLGPQDMTCIEAQNVDGSPAQGSCGGGSIVGMLAGFAGGGLAAMILDAKYLARFERHRQPASWTASIQPMHGGASVGVAGMF